MKAFLSRALRWLPEDRGAMSVQAIGLVAVSVAVVLGAWGYAEIQGDGPIGRIMFTYLEQQTDRLAGRHEGEVNYSEGKSDWSVALVPPESQPAEDQPPAGDPSRWDRLLAWFDRQAKGIEAAIADIGDLLNRIGDWFGTLPDWAKITLTAVIAVFVVVGVVVILVIAGVSLPLTGAALVIATAAAAVIAALAVVIYGLTHPGEAFKFWEGLGIGVLSGLATLALTFLGVIFGPSLTAWLTGTAWPWLTGQVAAAWAWLTGKAWPWLVGQAAAAWGLFRWRFLPWLAGLARSAWNLFRGRFLPWLASQASAAWSIFAGRFLPWLRGFLATRPGILLLHYVGYGIVKVGILDLWLGDGPADPLDYVLDAIFIGVGVYYLPAPLAQLGLKGKALWSGLVANARFSVTQVRTFGLDIRSWDWAGFPVRAAISSVSRYFVGGSGSILAPAEDRTVRVMLAEAWERIRNVLSGPQAPSPPVRTTITHAPSITPSPTSTPTPTQAPTTTPTPTPTPSSTPTPTETSEASPEPTDSGARAGEDLADDAEELIRRFRERRKFGPVPE